MLFIYKQAKKPTTPPQEHCMLLQGSIYCLLVHDVWKLLRSVLVMCLKDHGLQVSASFLRPFLRAGKLKCFKMTQLSSAFPGWSQHR